MDRLTTFGRLKFVDAQAFNNTERDRASALQFFNEWKKDPTVQVRRFMRVVRGGKASVTVEMIVVRRKEQ